MRVLQQEDLNFLLTNRIPRRLLTRFMGWFSRIEQPLVRALSIGVWRLFADLDLSRCEEDAASPACTIASRASSRRARDRSIAIPRYGEPLRRHRRRLRPRRGHPASPGQRVASTRRGSARRSRPGRRVPRRSLRHDPAHVQRCTTASTRRTISRRARHLHLGGYLERQPDRPASGSSGLFCKNERAVLRMRLTRQRRRHHAGPGRLGAGRRHPAPLPRRAASFAENPARNVMPATPRYRKGAEMGWFEHGSTDHRVRPRRLCRLCDGVRRRHPYSGPAVVASAANGRSGVERRRPPMAPAVPERVS